MRIQEKKKRVFYFLSLYLFCVLTSGFWILPPAVWADDLDAIISKVQKAYGLVYFKKPGMMKWEYKSPTNDIIVSDGRTIWSYQQDIGQVMVGNASDSSASISNNFLAGMGNLKKDFDIELEKPDNNSYVLKLNPKVPQPNIQRLYIAVDKKTSLVKQTIVFDLLGNETKVIFENLRINKSVPANIFKFKIPEGVRVVKP